MAQRPVAGAVGRSERHSVQAHTLEPSLPHNPHISCLSSAVTACMISGASAATAHRLNSCSAGFKRASPRQWPWAPALGPQGHHGVPDMACRARPLTTAIASSAAGALPAVGGDRWAMAAAQRCGEAAVRGPAVV